MSEPNPSSAWSLLRADWRMAAVTCLLTALSMALSIVLVGVGIFAFAAAQQLHRHVRTAFGATSRDWGVPIGVAIGALVLAVLVAGSWVALLDQLWPGHDLVTPSLLSFITRQELLAAGLVGLYLLCGWLLTPLLFVAVIACDPSAPRSWPDRMTRALRATFRLTVRARLGAIVLSAVALVGPLALLLVVPEPTLLLLVFGGWCVCLPILSALLVSRYAAVRDELASDEVRVLHVPGLLVLFGTVAAAFSVLALRAGSLTTAGVLAVGWFVTALSFYGYVGAHRMGKLASGDIRAPGRRAIEGVVEAGLFRTLAGVDFRVPPAELAALRTGEMHTLVGDFSAYRESFREGADQPWPRGARLTPGRIVDLMETRIQRTIWRTWLALGAVTIVAVVAVL